MFVYFCLFVHALPALFEHSLKLFVSAPRLPRGGEGRDLVEDIPMDISMDISMDIPMDVSRIEWMWAGAILNRNS